MIPVIRSNTLNRPSGVSETVKSEGNSRIVTILSGGYASSTKLMIKGISSLKFLESNTRKIEYDYANNKISFYLNSTHPSLTIDSSGNLGVSGRISNINTNIVSAAQYTTYASGPNIDTVAGKYSSSKMLYAFDESRGWGYNNNNNVLYAAMYNGFVPLRISTAGIVVSGTLNVTSGVATLEKTIINKVSMSGVLGELRIKPSAANTTAVVTIQSNGFPSNATKSSIIISPKDLYSDVSNYEALRFDTRIGGRADIHTEIGGGSGVLRPLRITTGTNQGIQIESNGNVNIKQTTVISGALTLATGSLRINKPPSSGVLTPLHSISINISGVMYRIPLQLA